MGNDRKAPHDDGNSLFMPTYRQPEWIAERGEGCWLWDTQGNVYLDFTSGIAVNALGHAHPRVLQGINEQSQRLLHTSNMFRHEPGIALARKLTDISFGDRVFFTNSGTEAIEGALKLARRYFYEHAPERTQIVATHGAFHGRTLGALSLTGQAHYREGYAPLLPGVQHVPFGDIEALAARVDTSTAAVVLEPIQGNAGVICAPDGYLEQVRELCTAHGCLLIVDEIQTGVGRTGAWYAHQHTGVVPDIMATAKALGGGLPLGAVVASQSVARAFGPGSHGSTFGGNPVCCAAALAVLETIESEALLEHVARLSPYLDQTLRDMAARLECIRDIRGKGFMVGVELALPARPVVQNARSAGLLVTAAGSHTLRLLPPLIARESDIEACVERLERAIAKSR